MVCLAGLGIAQAANAACIAGFQDAGGQQCETTRIVTGAPETITLPAGMQVITAIVSGAAGGTSLEEQVDPFGGAASPGGKGGRTTAIVPVASGASLTIVVGEAGTGGQLAPPGFGGYGGGGHASSRNGGNGGGGSYVFDDAGPLVVAGGGGGGGYDYNPIVLGHGDQQAPGGDGSGATPAGDGHSVPFCCDGTAPYQATGGGGATPNAGGLGGHPTLPPSYVFGQADGDAGYGPAIDAFNFGVGGSTHNGCCLFIGFGGGGGGGYYGGGGGGNIEAHLEGGGGGGGAGYVTPAAVSSTSETGVQVGDGEITIRYYAGACDPSCSTCTGPTAAECVTITTSTTIASTTTVATSSTSTTVVPVTTTTTLPPACEALRAAGCRTAAPGASSLILKNVANDRKDSLAWKWTHGVATDLAAFHDPVNGSATYRVCVYDASARPQPLMEMNILPGGTCGKKPCWKTTRKSGYAYANKAAAPEGIASMKLAAGIDGKAAVKVAGKGSSLPMTSLPLTAPVTIQLVVRNGGLDCWQTVYTTAAKNGPSKFSATGP